MAASLRDRCVDEALRIVAEKGLAHLSLREVSRRLEVSHQAPYKHFASREHLLAVAIARSYRALAAAIEGRPEAASPLEDMGGIGVAYLGFALAHPVHYRLLFELSSHELAAYEEAEAEAAATFRIVEKAVARLTGVDDEGFLRECSLFAWASVHGLASLAANQTLPVVGYFESEDQEKAIRGCLGMICGAIMARAEAWRAGS